MARKVATKDQLVRLIIGAGQASPSPPIGPALGSKGVKSIDFCKEFNALTNHINPGTPIPTQITVRPDRSFHFAIRTPPTSTLLLNAAGVDPTKKKNRGANAPGRTPESAVNVSTPALRSTHLAGSAQTSPGGGSLPAGTTDAHSAGGGNEVGMGVVKLVARSAAGGDKPAGSGGGTAQVGEVSLKHVWEIAKIKLSEERLQGLDMQGMVRSVLAQARTCGVGVVP